MKVLTSLLLLIYIIGRDCAKFNIKMAKSIHKVFIKRSRSAGLNKYERHMKREIGRNELV